MEYEEIKVGESCKIGGHTLKVLEKNDEHKAVMTIDEDGHVTAWDKNELELFQPIKKELPESGLLVHDHGSLMFRTGKTSGYGFNNRSGKHIFEIYEGWSLKLYPERWKPATSEDESKFIELLKQEAEKRGLGVDTKIKGHAGVWRTAFNTNTYAPKFLLKIAFNKNGQIFHNGIWAEPLTMLDEVTDVIKKHLPNIVIEQIDGVVTLKQL